jgi:hypothetical protein
MASSAITFRVDDSERRELVTRAERDKVSLSDYIRVRLGLHAQRSESDDEIQTTARTKRCGSSWSTTNDACAPSRTTTLGGGRARRDPRRTRPVWRVAAAPQTRREAAEERELDAV